MRTLRSKRCESRRRDGAETRCARIIAHDGAHAATIDGEEVTWGDDRPGTFTVNDTNINNFSITLPKNFEVSYERAMQNITSLGKSATSQMALLHTSDPDRNPEPCGMKSQFSTVCGQPANHDGPHSVIISGERFYFRTNERAHVRRRYKELYGVDPTMEGRTASPGEDRCVMVSWRGNRCTKPAGHGDDHRTEEGRWFDQAAFDPEGRCLHKNPDDEHICERLSRHTGRHWNKVTGVLVVWDNEKSFYVEPS